MPIKLIAIDAGSGVDADPPGGVGGPPPPGGGGSLSIGGAGPTNGGGGSGFGMTIGGTPLVPGGVPLGGVGGLFGKTGNGGMGSPKTNAFAGIDQARPTTRAQINNGPELRILEFAPTRGIILS
jgi:hypothetical protein